MPEMPGLFLIFHLCIRNGGIAYRTPVNNPAPLINPAFFVHLAEHFRHRFIASLVHGEPFPVPVAGRAQFFQLSDNPSAIFFLPLPGPFQKPFPSQVLFINAFLFQFFDNLHLCSDGGMICSRLPKGIISLHPFKADKDILHRIIQRMPHMKLPCDIWRRNHNRERFFAPVHLGMEIFLFHPFLINLIFDSFWVVSLC